MKTCYERDNVNTPELLHINPFVKKTFKLSTSSIHQQETIKMNGTISLKYHVAQSFHLSTGRAASIDKKFIFFQRPRKKKLQEHFLATLVDHRVNDFLMVWEMKIVIVEFMDWL